MSACQEGSTQYVCIKDNTYKIPVGIHPAVLHWFSFLAI